jgi:hypothetical protein
MIKIFSDFCKYSVLPFFCEKIGVFLKTRCYDLKLAVVSAKNDNFLDNFFAENISKL